MLSHEKRFHAQRERKRELEKSCRSRWSLTGKICARRLSRFLSVREKEERLLCIVGRAFDAIESADFVFFFFFFLTFIQKKQKLRDKQKCARVEIRARKLTTINFTTEKGFENKVNEIHENFIQKY